MAWPWTPPPQNPPGLPPIQPPPILPGPGPIGLPPAPGPIAPPNPGPTPTPQPGAPPNRNPRDFKPPQYVGPITPVGGRNPAGPLSPPGNPGGGAPRTDPGQGGFFDGFGPIGDFGLDRLGDILTRHLKLFDDIDLKDFITFVPPHAGISWMKPKDNPRMLGTREGQAALGVALKEARKADIYATNVRALKQFQEQVGNTPKVDAVTYITSPDSEPNRPDGSKSAFTLNYDRRQRGRFEMLNTVPADVAATLSTVAIPEINTSITAVRTGEDVDTVQMKSPGVARNFYENNISLSKESETTAQAPKTPGSNFMPVLGTIAVAIIGFMILRKA